MPTLQDQTSTPQDVMFQEAMSAIQAGERARARDLLTRLLKLAPNQPDYWIWMSAVVETPKERALCLKEALRLDPENAAARRGLVILGAMPPDPVQAVPAGLQKRNWQSKVALAENSESGVKTVALSRPQLAMMAVALVVVIGLVGYAIWGAQKSRTRRRMPVIYLPSATAVAAADTTATPAPATPQGSPTPLWMLLQTTYTPTPLYVNTPHSISEAYRIGIRAFQRGDWPAAQNYFKQVATTQPGSVDILYHLGESYRMAGEESDALEVFEQAIQLDPEFAPSYLGRARVRIAQNHAADAVRDIQTAIEKDPRFGEAYLELAAYQIKNGQFQEVFRTLDRAETILPDAATIDLYRAQAYMASGEIAAALKYARRANERDVTLLAAYRLLGEALQTEGDIAASYEPLNTYVLYEPDDAQAWAMLARAHFANGNLVEAGEALDHALRLDGRLVDALLLRAHLRLEQGDAENALKDYQAAQKLDTRSFEAGLGIGKALMALGYPGDGYMQFERVQGLIETDRQKAEQLFWRAQSLEKLGEKEVALRDWQALLALPPASVEPAWAELAEKRVSALAVRTPTPRSKFSTATAAPGVRQVVGTKTPARTRTPTSTVEP